LGEQLPLAPLVRDELDRDDWPEAFKHGFATLAGFVSAGVVPLVVYPLPVDEGIRSRPRSA
jgi:hypothetical protein